MSDYHVEIFPKCSSRHLASAVLAQRDGCRVLPLLSGSSVPTFDLLKAAGVPIRDGHLSPTPFTGDPQDFARELGGALGCTPDRGHVVAVVHDSFAWPAVLFATYHGRSFRLVRDLKRAIKQAREVRAPSLTVFGPAEAFTEPLLRTLADDANLPIVPVGIATGRSPTDVWAWVARRSLAARVYRQHRGAIIVSQETAAAVAGTEVVFLYENEVSQKILEDLAEIPRDCALLELHSKETCGRLGSSLLCGLPDHEPMLELGRYVAAPGCAFHNPCVWGDRPRLPVRNINAAHLLTISCHTLRLHNHLAHLSYSLGMNAFCGRIRSLVAPTRVVFINPLFMLTAQKLFLSGCRLGSVVVALNESLQAQKLDLPCFLLLGDPEDAPLRGYEVRSKRGEQLQDRPPSISTKTSAEETATAVALQHSRTQAENCVVDNFLQYAAAGFFRRGEALKAIDALGSKSGQFSQELLRISEIVVRDWIKEDRKQGFWLTLGYQCGTTRAVSSSGQCRVCGELIVEYVRHDACRQWSRRIEICPRCCIVADLPETDTVCWLGSSQQTRPGERITVRLRIEGRAPLGLVAAGISITHSEEFGWPDLFRTHCLNLRKKRDLDWHITLQIPVLYPAFVHYIHTYFLIDGVPWFLSRPLTVLKRSPD